jgi:hypothetical protein
MWLEKVDIIREPPAGFWATARTLQDWLQKQPYSTSLNREDKEYSISLLSFDIQSEHLAGLANERQRYCNLRLQRKI